MTSSPLNSGIAIPVPPGKTVDQFVAELRAVQPQFFEKQTQLPLVNLASACKAGPRDPYDHIKDLQRACNRELEEKRKWKTIVFDISNAAEEAEDDFAFAQLVDRVLKKHGLGIS